MYYDTNDVTFIHLECQVYEFVFSRPFKEVNRVDKPWQKPIITASANPNDTRRSREETQRLYEQLIQVFPNKDQSLRVYQVLENHCTETDLVKLTNYVMNALFSKDH